VERVVADYEAKDGGQQDADQDRAFDLKVIARQDHEEAGDAGHGQERG